MKLSQSLGKMQPSIKNSYLLAFAESKYIEHLNKLESTDLDAALKELTTFNHEDKNSPINTLMISASGIRNNNWFRFDSDSHSNITYSLCAAKRKIERQFDWILSSFDQDLLSKIENFSEEQIIELTHLLTKSHGLNMYKPENAEVVRNLNEKLMRYQEDKEWKNAQHLALIFRNNTKENNAVNIDSKMVPDANDLQKVISIIDHLINERITISELAQSLKISNRMALYYLDASVMLGIMEKKNNDFVLSELGEKMNRYSIEDRHQIMKQLLLKLPVVEAFLLHLDFVGKTRFALKDITKFLLNTTDLSSNTSHRRASTLASWLCNIGIVKRHNKMLILKQDGGQTTLNEYFA